MYNCAQGIPSSVENFIFDKASASGLQQAEPMSKQPMCKHMGDADSCKDGDAGAVKSEVFNRTWYKLFIAEGEDIGTDVFGNLEREQMTGIGSADDLVFPISVDRDTAIEIAI